MFLAGEINQILESKKDRLTKPSSYFYICDVLNRAFKKPLPFRFKYETYKDYKRNEYSVSGLYDMDVNTKYVIFNLSETCKTLHINESRWREFKFSISQVCQHETIHQLQWQHRDGSEMDRSSLEFRESRRPRSEEKEYLSDFDEIDAYAHDIAMEIKFYYPKHHPYNVLKTLNQRKKLWSYSYYKKTFKGENWDPIKARLLKKTYLWLPYVQV